ncbi:hypothetical protein J6590_106253, partial [Homalodisca vitripennis]
DEPTQWIRTRTGDEVDQDCTTRVLSDSTFQGKRSPFAIIDPSRSRPLFAIVKLLKHHIYPSIIIEWVFMFKNLCLSHPQKK